MKSVDSDRLNRWLTFGANVGVLIGIILLIVELGQNRDMMKSQIRNELAIGIIDISRGIAENSEFANVMVRARAAESLTPTEQLQYLNAMVVLFRYWENVHYQYRMGLYDDSEFSTHKEAWRIVMNRDEPAAQIWCDRRLTFSPEFRTDMDELLSNFSC